MPLLFLLSFSCVLLLLLPPSPSLRIRACVVWCDRWLRRVKTLCVCCLLGVGRLNGGGVEAGCARGSSASRSRSRRAARPAPGGDHRVCGPRACACDVRIQQKRAEWASWVGSRVELQASARPPTSQHAQGLQAGRATCPAQRRLRPPENRPFYFKPCRASL